MSAPIASLDIVELAAQLAQTLLLDPSKTERHVMDELGWTRAQYFFVRNSKEFQAMEASLTESVRLAVAHQIAQSAVPVMRNIVRIATEGADRDAVKAQQVWADIYGKMIENTPAAVAARRPIQIGALNLNVQPASVQPGLAPHDDDIVSSVVTSVKTLPTP